MAESDRTALKNGLLIAVVSTVLGVLGTMFVQHLAKEKPRLIYDLPSPAFFVAEKQQVGIMQVRVANRGNALAKDVNVLVTLSEGMEIKGFRVQTLGTAVEYGVEDRKKRAEEADPRMRRVRFPTLNPDEGCVLSILAEGGEGEATVGVRGEGVVGVLAGANSAEQSVTEWLVGTFAGIGMGVSILLLIILVKDFRPWGAQAEKTAERP